MTQFITSANISLLVVGCLFCFPFTVAYHHLPIAAFYGEWLSALLGVVAMLALLNRAPELQIQPPQVPQIALVFVGLAAILAMQYTVGMLHSTQYALLIASYLAWAFMLVVLGGFLRAQLGWDKIAIVLAWFIVLGGLINVVFVGLQLGLKSGLGFTFMPNFSSYGALAQRNNFADYIALATASTLYLYAKKQLSVKPFLVVLSLFITLLAFSGSRSAWLYLGTITALAFVWQLSNLKQTVDSTAINRLFKASLLLIPLFMLIQFLLANGLADTLIELPNERIGQTLESNNSSLRAQFWHTSWHWFMQSPWLGIGTGQMRWHSFLLLDNPAANPANMIFEHSHNLFMHLLAEMGVGAALLALIGLGSWLWAFKWHALTLEKWWLLVLIAIIGIHSMLEYPLWYTYFLGVFAFLLGAGDEKFTQLNLPQKAQKPLKILLALSLVLGVCNLATMCMAYQKLENQLAVAGQAIVLPEQKITFMNDLTWVHQNSVLAPYAELMLATYSPPSQQHASQQLALTQNAIKFMPMQRINMQYALLLEITGQHAPAIAHLKRLLVAYPSNMQGQIQQLPIPYQQTFFNLLQEARTTPQP
jgi:O-antigen ligase